MSRFIRWSFVSFTRGTARLPPTHSGRRSERLRFSVLASAFASCLGMSLPSQAFATTYEVDATGITLWGLLDVTGTFDTAGDYDYKVEEGGPSGYIYFFTDKTGLIETSQIPPGPCVLGPPCPTRGKAELAPFVDPGAGFSSFGLGDSGETFSATGTATFLSSGNVGGPPGTPEPTTWAMMLIGFAGLALAAYRPRRFPRLLATQVSQEALSERRTS
jgi:PEP-CTERM motif